MKKKFFALSMTLFLLVSLITGCGDANNASVTASEDEKAQVENLSEEAEISEPDANVQENESVTAEDLLRTHLAELGQSSFCLVVQNESTQEEVILENGATYTLKDGDRFFVCAPSEIYGISHSEYIEPVLSDVTSFFEFYVKDIQDIKNVFIEITYKNEESEKIDFTLLPSDYVNIPEDYQCYLYSGFGEKVIGFNVPENWYTFLETEQIFYYNITDTNESVCIENGDYNNIDVYNGITTHVEYEGSTSDYLYKRSYETPYGEAQIYDVTSLVKTEDESFEMIEEIVLIKINGNYVRITISKDNASVPSDNAENILSELFE